MKAAIDTPDTSQTKNESKPVLPANVLLGISPLFLSIFCNIDIGKVIHSFSVLSKLLLFL
jgi:hypothetical protein